MNTLDFLNIGYLICPDRHFIVFENETWSYAQVNERVNKLAHALIRLGVKKGDRIGMVQVNCNQYVEVYFAAAKIGAIFVPLNFRAKADELSYMIGNASAKVLFAGERYLDLLEKKIPDLSMVEHFICLDGVRSNNLSYDSLIQDATPEDFETDIDDEDVTILMYTSGTTGRPKGVPLKHSGFASYVLENVEPANPDTEERNLLTMPLYHVAGIQAMLAAVYGGRTLVLMKQFETEEWMRTVQEYQTNRAMLVPTMLKWIVDHPEFENYDLTSLKVITYGAAPMPFEVIKKAIEKLSWVRFINAFGQTETASTITSLGPEDHVIEGTEEEKEKKLKRLTSSIGRPLPDVAIKIVGPDNEELPPDEQGEIMAKGPRVMTGYWEDEEKTKAVMTEDGWLHTGDRGWRDEDGYIFLTGRVDDMIIRGGENISAKEVEDVLCGFSKIEEAACIGLPDPDWGQKPVAVVVLKEGESSTEEEIIHYCKDKLAGFKRPESIFFTDSLPRNQLEKVLKSKLREEYGDRA